VILAAVAAVIFGGYYFLGRGDNGPDVDYRYAKIQKGELVRSISATGQLVALTSVDVKSKAGGKVLKLVVQEGTKVKEGDLIATIDPTDTQAVYDQAAADMTSSQARADQASINAQLQAEQAETSVRDAEIALDQARIRLKRAEVQDKGQPALSNSSLNSAQAALKSAQEDLRKLEQVTVPQTRRDVASTLSRSQIELKNAKADAQRQRELYNQGYASRNDVEKAENSVAASQAAFDVATERANTVDKQIDSDLKSAHNRVEQATASLTSAKTNMNQVDLSGISVDEARKSVAQAEVSLRVAKQQRTQIRVKQMDVKSAQANTVRSRVSLNNAKVQLDSTTVTAPREGIVTTKYLEEGTIIPPATSAFSQGTSLVAIADTSRMFVECLVDEADIAQVKLGQKVRVVVEAFPGMPINGEVQRINPAAATANNITAVKVRIEITGPEKAKLMPGMNATCEFLTLQHENVLLVPSQAVKRDKGKTTVRIKKADGTLETREIKVGPSGNDGFEVMDGLKEGDEVVVAEINLKQLRDVQQKMVEAQQGGGLTGGNQGPRPSSGGGTGGARSGAGGGGMGSGARRGG